MHTQTKVVSCVKVFWPDSPKFRPFTLLEMEPCFLECKSFCSFLSSPPNSLKVLFANACFLSFSFSFHLPQNCLFYFQTSHFTPGKLMCPMSLGWLLKHLTTSTTTFTTTTTTTANYYYYYFHELLCVHTITWPDYTLLSNNIRDYHFQSQGKVEIPGVDDGEEFKCTDVSCWWSMIFVIYWSCQPLLFASCHLCPLFLGVHSVFVYVCLCVLFTHFSLPTWSK